MQVELTFTFDNPDEAASFLAVANGTEWPSSGARANRTGGKAGGSVSASADERPPWDEDEADASTSERTANDSADPWADETTATKPAKPQRSAQHVAAGVLFPASNSYVRDTPNGKRTWTFGVENAPDCDCGYPAALVTGRKAGAKKDWNAYWCPIGFTKSWKDKCQFSEFAD